MLFGIDWMDPNWLLDQFGGLFFWVSLVIILVECGLFFPFLPGDTLLFAMGLFIAGGKIDIIPGGARDRPAVRARAAVAAAAFAGNVSATRSAAGSAHPSTSATAGSSSASTSTRPTAFFDKHGNKALVIGRFVPFVRTYITVVAGRHPDGPPPVLPVERGRRRRLGRSASPCSATSSARPSRA